MVGSNQRALSCGLNARDNAKLSNDVVDMKIDRALAQASGLSPLWHARNDRPDKALKRQAELRERAFECSTCGNGSRSLTGNWLALYVRCGCRGARRCSRWRRSGVGPALRLAEVIPLYAL